MRTANIFVVIITFLVLFLIDYYVYQGVKVISKDWTSPYQTFTNVFYWSFVIVIYLLFLGFFRFGLSGYLPSIPRNFIMGALFVIYLSKLVFILFLLMDDLIRLLKYIFQLFQKDSTPVDIESTTITRSEFLVKAGGIIATTPIIASTYGILSGAHDYQIRRERIVLPNLPKEFHGIKIAQISDIHSGSFFNKVAVKGGVEMLLAEKPDITFFTGDLVNNKSEEVSEYINIFQKVKSPLGVYSILGNHDYGMYVKWDSPEAEKANLDRLKEAHKALGWELLLDENREIIVDGASIALLGVENWGEGFLKKGNLAKAYQNIEHLPVKILLSHDPSHWDAQVRPEFSDIDLMLAGHTHGFQFGIEIGDFKWSPVQYRYKQWGGLYTESNQHLYVNRGYGYLGFPGRVGMPPEITIIELVKS